MQRLRVYQDDPLSLQSALQDDHWQTRLEAVQAINANQSLDNLKLLLSMLSDADSNVRDAVAEGIMKYGHDALEGLQRILHTGNLVSREAAVQILHRSQDPHSQPVIIHALLHDESAWVRVPAAQALGGFGGEEALTALIQAFKDAHPDVLRAARAALEQIGTPTALAALKTHSENQS